MNETQDNKHNEIISNNRENINYNRLSLRNFLIRPSMQQLHKYISSESGKEISVYATNSQPVIAFDIMEEMQEKNVLCDVTLVAADGRMVPAHKLILSACSPYFHAIFKNFKEGGKSCYVINEIEHDVLKLLVKFMYSNKIHINEDNVQSLLAAADFLEIMIIVKACCDFMLKHLHPSNCFKFQALATQYSCFDLLAQTMGYLERHFSIIIQHEAFLTLSPQELEKIVSNDHLATASEKDVFECVISWANHKPKDREQYFTKLMEQVRLPLISQMYLINRLQEEPFFKANPQFKDYLMDAMKYHLIKGSEESSFGKCKLKPRIPRELPKLLVAVGGSSSSSCRSVECLDLETNVWEKLSDFPKDFRKGHLTVLGGNIYALDDSESGSMNVYDASVDQWSACAKMKKIRKHFGVGTLENRIYVMGGCWSCNVYNSVEVYDPLTKTWSMIPSMSTPRCNFAVGVLNGRIYVVGGTSRSYHKDMLSSVECYDPDMKLWIPVTSLPEPRCHASASAVNGILYVVGGENDKNIKLNSTTAFNLNTNVWTTLVMKLQHFSIASVLEHNGKLYALGSKGKDTFWGFDEKPLVITHNISTYCIESDTWEVLSTCMNTGQCHAGIAIIDKPHNYVPCLK